MRTELPAERLARRLGNGVDEDRGGGRDHQWEVGGEGGADGADDSCEDGGEDPNSLLPRWLPEPGGGPGMVDRLRADPGRAGAIALAVIAAFAVLVTIFTLARDRPAAVMSAKLPPVEQVSSRTSEPSANPQAAERSVVVSVVGLVHQPGVVTLTPGARVADALQAAGGAVDGADLIGLNMARPLGDGEQIVVGLAPPPGKPPVMGSSVGAGSATAPASSNPAGVSGSPATVRDEALDLNTATAGQLDTLPGVGPVTAAAIVAWRQANGGFSSIDQLAEVDGIGPARLDKLRGLVRV